MNMQVLLEKSSIFTKVLKDQMDRTREKHAAVAIATQNRATKTKPKQRAKQAGRRASGRGKRAWRVTTSVTLRTKECRSLRSASRSLPTTRNPPSCSLRWSLVLL